MPGTLIRKESCCLANLKIGTIGLGRLGYHHTKNVTRTFGAELVAVADAFPDALKRGETDFGVKVMQTAVI